MGRRYMLIQSLHLFNPSNQLGVIGEVLKDSAYGGTAICICTLVPYERILLVAALNLDDADCRKTSSCQASEHATMSRVTFSDNRIVGPTFDYLVLHAIE